MSEQRRQASRPKQRRDRSSRHAARNQLNQLRGMKVKDALGRATKQTTNPIQSTGDDNMADFKVVPAPDDPTMFVVQSEPMPRDEAEKQAEMCNNLKTEEKEEGEMPGFKAGGPAMPPFAMRPGGPGAGARPPMPPMPPMLG